MKVNVVEKTKQVPLFTSNMLCYKIEYNTDNSTNITVYSAMNRHSIGLYIPTTMHDVMQRSLQLYSAKYQATVHNKRYTLSCQFVKLTYLQKSFTLGITSRPKSVIKSPFINSSSKFATLTNGQ